MCYSLLGNHHCLHYNERFSSVTDLIQHQKTRQHFDGRCILQSRSSPQRRVPTRFKTHEEENEIDNSTGALSLRNDSSDDECSDVDICKTQNVPACEDISVEVQEETGTSEDVDSGPSTVERSLWVQKLNLDGIGFNNTFYKVLVLVR